MSSNNFNNTIAVHIPKKAIVRTFVSKNIEYSIIDLKGKYKGFELMYPSFYLKESKYGSGFYYTYMAKDHILKANKRIFDENSNTWSTVVTKNITPFDLIEMFHKKK